MEHKKLTGKSEIVPGTIYAPWGVGGRPDYCLMPMAYCLRPTDFLRVYLEPYFCGALLRPGPLGQEPFIARLSPEQCHPLIFDSGLRAFPIRHIGATKHDGRLLPVAFRGVVFRIAEFGFRLQQLGNLSPDGRRFAFPRVVELLNDLDVPTPQSAQEGA